jgi:hypothetical protein
VVRNQSYRKELNFHKVDAESLDEFDHLTLDVFKTCLIIQHDIHFVDHNKKLFDAHGLRDDQVLFRNTCRTEALFKDTRRSI